MSKVTESIFNSKRCIIPLSKVSWIEKSPPCAEYDSISIIMESSNYVDGEGWSNATFLMGEDAENFLKAWTRYRHEIENGRKTFTCPKKNIQNDY